MSLSFHGKMQLPTLFFLPITGIPIQCNSVHMTIIHTVDVLGCHCGLPPGPVIDMGGIPGPPGPPGPGPPGPPGPRVLLGGGPLMPGP